MGMTILMVFLEKCSEKTSYLKKAQHLSALFFGFGDFIAALSRLQKRSYGQTYLA
ncbi:hypothetical protein ACVWYG_001602 [Pedobacter sp. UYEF25]